MNVSACADVQIHQFKDALSREKIDSITHWFIAAPAKDIAGDALSGPYTEMLQQRWRSYDAEHQDILYLQLPNVSGTRAVLLGMKKAGTVFQQLSLGRRMFALFGTDKPIHLGIWVQGFCAEECAQLTEALLSAALAGGVNLPTFKNVSEAAVKELQSIHIYGAPEQDFSRTLAVHQGNYLARALSILPGNHLTPALYREYLEQLAEKEGWQMHFYDQETLERKKAGAFLAVVQGSAEKDAGIMHLRYNARVEKAKTLSLVGKGLCFDTGGYQLKSSKGMQDMHQDMQGSAAALGTMLALSRLGAEFNIDCWLALAENHIGPRAYKINDVVKALDGTSIEIVHTDAEGRMVLADTLTFAARAKPNLIMDYATLTGACITALGDRYSGVFSNRDEFYPVLTENGRRCGERVWPFPMDEDYDEALESDIADTKQCILGGEADHILGARFLQRFIAEIPWIHMDISTSPRDKGLAHIPTATLGFGVRYSVYLFLDAFKMRLQAD